MRGLIDGLSNKEIAEKMNIGVSAVKHHVTHIMEKSGVRKRMMYFHEAIEKFIKTGKQEFDPVMCADSQCQSDEHNCNCLRKKLKQNFEEA